MPLEPVIIYNRGRGPEVYGTRITVYDIVPYRLAGRSTLYIADVLNLSVREVNALFQYMDEHYEEVMEVNRKFEERVARGNPPEVEERLKPGRAKFQARLAESAPAWPRRQTMKALLADANIERHVVRIVSRMMQSTGVSSGTISGSGWSGSGISACRNGPRTMSSGCVVKTKGSFFSRPTATKTIPPLWRRPSAST